MISAFRLLQKKWLKQAFDGEGAKLYGGRWNSIGIPCVYATSSESLSILEVMVHVTDPNILKQYTLLQFEFNESDLLQTELSDLPDNWRDSPAPDETATFGDEWLNSNVSLALRLPSAIVPREFNYLININHSSFNRMLRTVQELDFALDERLIQLK